MPATDNPCKASLDNKIGGEWLKFDLMDQSITAAINNFTSPHQKIDFSL